MVDSLLFALILTMLSMQFISLQIKDLGLAPILNGALITTMQFELRMEQLRSLKTLQKIRLTKPIFQIQVCLEES